MLLTIIGLALILVLAVLFDFALGTGLLLKLFSKTPDGPERPRYRGR